MSDDRRTRRRFLADALFAGGALTAASLLGYATTRPAREQAEVRPAGGTPAAMETPAETPCAVETPDLHPGGAVTITTTPERPKARDPRTEPLIAGRMVPSRKRP